MQRPLTPFKLMYLCLAVVVGLSCSLFQAAVPEPTDTPPSNVPAKTVEPGSPVETPSQPLDPTIQPPEPTADLVPAQPLRVAYVKDGNVWLWEENAASRSLTSSGNIFQVDLSDDGTLVAFSRQADEMNTELWAVNTDGSAERRLLSASDLTSLVGANLDPNASGIAPFQIGWQPGTHRLAFNTRPVFIGPGLVGYNDLHWIDVDSLERVTLLPPGQGGMFVYSPDGARLAVMTPSQISLVQADGSGRLELLSYAPVSTYSEYAYYAHPQWSADGAYLRLALPPAEALAEPRPPTTVWQLPADGSAPIQLSSFVAAPFFGTEVLFSPDLEQITYIKELEPLGQNNYELHTARADLSNDQLLLGGGYMLLTGWGGSADQFMFQTGEPLVTNLASINGGMHPLAADSSQLADVRWVDSQRYLNFHPIGEMWEFRLDSTAGETFLIDNIPFPPSYDFAP